MNDGGALCPLCGRISELKFRPFCGKRCADIDLGRWLSEKYSVPAEEMPDDIIKTDEVSDDD